MNDATSEGRLEVDWPWRWEPEKGGRGLIVTADGTNPVLRTWSYDDTSPEMFHFDAITLLGVDAERIRQLEIDPAGKCTCYGIAESDRDEVASFIAAQDSRLRLTTEDEDNTWNFG